MPEHKVIAILGPTGTGKSQLALALAEKFAGEVVNCDSLQVYRYFDIGTAKLPTQDRRGIPHHLIDILDPDQVFSAGEYARLARGVLAEISHRGHVPILAGGTGFYFRALVDGLFPGPSRDQPLRDRLTSREHRRPGSIYRLLRHFDPAAAQRIHPNDFPKLVRALEVCLLTRRAATEMFRHGRDSLQGYSVLKIGLSPHRDQLYEKLDHRTEQMFHHGLIEEVQGILVRGFPVSSKPFESHGYKQTLQLLAGELSLKEAIFYAQRNTRRYAKRQVTWFRQEQQMEWVAGFGDDPLTIQSVLDRAGEFLMPGFGTTKS